MTKTRETDFKHPPRGHAAILYYDVTNDRFQVVQGDDVDTAIPAAAKALLASSLAHGYDGSAWRKLPLLWGYNDRVVESLGGTKSDAGTYNALSTAVPEGEVHVIQLTTIRNITGDRGAVSTYMYDGTNYYCLKWATSSTRYDAQLVTGEFVLSEGDRINVRMASCLDNDELEGGIWGYKMTINM